MKHHLVSIVSVYALLASAAFAQQAATASKISGTSGKFTLSADGLPEPIRSIDVASLADLEKAIAAAKPGDQIALADGEYKSAAPIKIQCKGTADHPVLITAQTVGGAEITGIGSFEFDNEVQYVTLRGFTLKHAAPTVVVPAGASHCRVSRNLFELALNGRSTYCQIAGDDCEIDHNEFRNKKTEGEMLLVVGPGTSEMAQRTWIHHNYFRDFRSPPANNCSAIQIGMSGRSMSSGWSITEYNLFTKCAGENEGCICNKSSDNTYRFNTFGEGSTELSIRHGNRCNVYSNFFIASTGIRIFGHDHKIYSNYFERCRPAIHIGNGDGIVPPAKLTAHDKPVGLQIVFNTLVNNKGNIVMRGRNRGLGAGDTVIADSIVLGGPKAAAIEGPLQDPVWQGNIIWNNEGGAGEMPDAGSKSIDPQLQPDATGQFRLDRSSPAIGAAAGSFPFVTLDVNGRPRGSKPDVGAEQFTSIAATNRILNATDVGTTANEDPRVLPVFNAQH